MVYFEKLLTHCFVIFLFIFRHFSRKYPIRLTIREKQPNKSSPASRREHENEMNWFDFEEIKEVSATFLERERQYEIKKEDVSFFPLLFEEQIKDR